ncbi:MAG: hypothetical protein Wins2KO_25970 [Winogradskyella sp.]|uniref:toxin-antitoxin system YwqK family antitoxin n=1 Tax=Winogradskyella sp. TaxID=1883156 RepID=UPI0025EF0430|nr:hypothetical protein [Winogradskyella sp.]NRB60209.1 hypothetical protein [Winogradskyella sp.]
MRTIFLLFLFSQLGIAQKHYQKNYFDNGQLESAGWMENGQKSKFWYYYHKNGNLKAKGHYKVNKKTKFWAFYNESGQLESEGHFNRGKRINWWVYYDNKGRVTHKCQVHNNKKNGYCLMYTNGKLSSAVKYKFDKKIKEWTDLRSFKKENRLSDLR